MTRPVIVNISLGGPESDYDRQATLLGHTFRIIRVGTSGDVEAAIDVARTWSERAAAFAFSGIRETPDGALLDITDADVAALRRACRRVPLTDGHRLADVLEEWSIRAVQTEYPAHFTNARTSVLGGGYKRAVAVLESFTRNIEYVPVKGERPNPVIQAAKSVKGLADEFADKAKEAVRDPLAPALWAMGKIAQPSHKGQDVVVGLFDDIISAGPSELSGITVISSAISPEREAELAERDVDMIVDTTPQPFRNVTVVTAVLEAMMLHHRGKRKLDVESMLTAIEEAGLQPRLLHPNGPRRKSRFAFVIHPLSTQYFRNVEPLGSLTKVPGMTPVIEKAAAYFPPFVYGRMTGITSPTGAEAEGWLISVGGTPKELLAHSPEFTYDRLLEAAEIAQGLGAQVMGLGAFTKVVGDAGVTVAQRAPLPVTTGNSYSASGALWAAHEAIRRLGIAEIDADGRLRGKAMVVGATGAIGSVCARLLAMACDELWLVSPETAKLLTIKHSIERENPRASVHVAAKPDKHLPEMDMIVTATSAAGQKVLDVMRIKPGCVVTDVARPLDLSAEEVAKRPDILVIESGEIELPGDVHMRDIGLPKGVAYACLAETVVLALEGRYERFTVGREIEWAKVKEIYQLGLKHGMKLATISGVNGVFTEADFARVRELALAARAAQEAKK